MQRVLLTIKGTQRDGDSSELVEFITEGRLKKEPHGYLIEYDESELTGFDGCTTSLFIRDDGITLRRTDDAALPLVFSPGQVYSSMLNTPGGTVFFQVYAFRVESNLTEKSGSVLFEYELSMGSTSVISTIDLSFKSMEDCIN